MRHLALCLSFLMVSGCSTLSYSGRPVPVPKIEAMPVWRTEGSVTIGVDAYIQPARQKEVFDDDLEKAGVLPIYLLIKNHGERPLSLRRRSEIPLADIALELPDGNQISFSVPSETVLRMLGRIPPSGGGAYMSGKDVGEMLYVAIHLFPLIPFAIAAGVAADRATEARITGYLDKEFKNIKLNKDESTQGFVYLTIPVTYWGESKLVLRFVDETDGSDFVVRVPVMSNRRIL
jgi:hypothetical protein